MQVDAQPDVADAAVVRRRFAAGASVRLLHPQLLCAPLAAALSLLEDALQCPMGCNAYLTPPGSQVRVTVQTFCGLWVNNRSDKGLHGRGLPSDINYEYACVVDCH